MWSKILKLMLVLAFLPSVAWADCTADPVGQTLTYTCSAGTTVAQIQAKLNVASDNAVFTFLNGSYSLNANIAPVDGKGVSFICQSIGGCDVSLNGRSFYQKFSVYKEYRISGFDFAGNGSGSPAVFFWTNYPNTFRVRIDNNTFSNIGGGSRCIVLGEQQSTDGRIYGIIHDNTFTGSSNYSGVNLQYQGPGNLGEDGLWVDGEMGTAEPFFVEDNVFNFGAEDTFGSGCIDAAGAVSVVFRHNTATNCHYITHSYCHKGPYSQEVYNNAITIVAREGAYGRAIHFQGGGEIIAFNNVLSNVGSPLEVQHFRGTFEPGEGFCGTNYCTGSQSFDGNRTGKYGYPCWHQPGRNKSDELKPMYFWNNTDRVTGERVTLNIANNNNAVYHLVSDRDYYNAVSKNAQTSPTSPFNGTTGMGFGTLANMPTTCTPTPEAADAGNGGVGYWATDAGGNWNTKNATANDGELYRCSARDTWTRAYTPYTYPHPLQGPADRMWPLRISASGRYLEDQAGVPFQIHADAGWHLTTQISKENAVAYLDDRLAKGFNAVEIRVIDHTYQTNAPNNYYGNPPFTNHLNWSTVNEVYWTNVDYIVSAAKDRGMVLLMFPAYLGANCVSGQCSDMVAQTNAAMTTYGTWIGSRYASYGNILWMRGGDYDCGGTTNACARDAAVVTGVRAGFPGALFSVEPGPWQLGGVDSYVSDTDINGVYTYGGTSTMVQSAYGNSRPFMHQEGVYENEQTGTYPAVTQQSQAFSTLLGGGLVGHTFGACPLWSFGSQMGFCSSASAPYNSWSNCMASPGSVALGNIGKLMRSRKWWTLVPDYANTVVTSAKGSDPNYKATARETSGKTIMVWNPPNTTITVDMSKITDSGSQAKAWWWNPADNVGTLIGTYANSGSRVFTPPAAQRVLVIDSNALALAAPGLTTYSETVATPPSAQGCTIQGATPGQHQCAESYWPVTPVTMACTTDMAATCKYDDTDTTYALMDSTFSTTGTTSHSQSLTVNCGQTYTYYMRCSGSGGAMTTSYPITFSLDKDPPPRKVYNISNLRLRR